MPMMNSSANPETALSVVEFGEEACQPRHNYGPAMRAYYLLHYVASGKGELSAGGKIHPVGPGQAFLIYPGEITFYQADTADPWHYAWVGFSGSQAEEMTRLMGFDRENRVVSARHPQECWDALFQMRRDAAGLRLGQLAALGGLYRFSALIAREQDQGEEAHHARHYEKAIWYMQGTYTRDVSIQEIADFLGLSRSQLFRIFEKSCGQSPKQVLQGMRLHQALLLLQQTSLSVEQVALSVGYCSGGQLSAAFREKYGSAPRQWRRQNKAKKIIS